MEQQVRGAKLDEFTAGSGNGRSAPFGDASTLRRLSIAGYQVLQEPDIPDWVLFRPVSSPFLLYDRRPFTGATTVKANS